MASDQRSRPAYGAGVGVDCDTTHSQGKLFFSFQINNEKNETKPGAICGNEIMQM